MKYGMAVCISHHVAYLRVSTDGGARRHTGNDEELGGTIVKMTCVNPMRY
jgi:hypothetical protein